MANELDDWLKAYDDYMPVGIANEPSSDLQNQVPQISTGGPWVGNAPPQVAGIVPGDSQEEGLSDESDTEGKLLEGRVQSLEKSIHDHRNVILKMSRRLKELPSRRTLQNLEVNLREMSESIEDLQSKIPEIYAKDKNRDLQHTQLSEKIDNLHGWANQTKGTLDKVVNGMRYMRGENENTTASNRQRNNNNQRIRRSRVV